MRDTNLSIKSGQVHKGIGRRLWAASHHWNARRKVSGKVSDLASELTDALAHLEWASTYQYEEGDTEKTAKYRNKLKGNMANAKKIADAASRPAVAKMAMHLKELEQTSMSKDDVAAAAMYARLAIELRAAIAETWL